MHFVVHCLDRPGAQDLRQRLLQAHRDYLAAAPIRALVSGPLLADDGETMIGSFFLLEAASKEEVLAFQRADPLYRADLWAEIRVHALVKRVDNR
jgi:hypothetical protein